MRFNDHQFEKKSCKRMMDDSLMKLDSINEVYPLVGDGIIQWLSIFVVCLSIVPAAMQQYIMVFLALRPSWVQIVNTDHPSWSTINSTSRFELLLTNNTDEIIVQPDDDNYDDICNKHKNLTWYWKEEKSYSTVIEFELYCDKESVINIITMVYFAFTMCGSFVWGLISDKYGRKKALFIGTFINVTLTMVTAFTNNLVIFGILKSINGLFAASLLGVMMTYCAEIVSGKYRVYTPVFIFIFYSAGGALMSWVSYLVKSWRKLLLYSSVPYYLVVGFIWFLPESIAWLFNKGDGKAVLKQMKMLAKVNRKEPIVFTQLKVIQQTKVSKEKTKVNFLQLWKPFNVFLKTTKLLIAWIFVGVGYIGIALATGNLTGNVHRDFAIVLTTEGAAAITLMITVPRTGKKVSTIGPMAASGVLLIIVAALTTISSSTSYETSSLVLGVTARYLVTISFICITSWTLEMYPTYLRSTATGFFIGSANFGMMLSTWIADWLRRYDESLPFYIMGSTLLFSSCLLIKIESNDKWALRESLEGDETSKSQQLEDSK